jgi:hypothetical protein
MTIQQAMLDAVRSRKGGAVPPRLQWGNLTVQTSDCVAVPSNGRIRLEFLSAKQGFKQGVDIKVSGAIRLADGEAITTLRTWDDPRYESAVEYSFESHDGKLWVWNVYEVAHPSGEVEATKWTDNAGFWVEDHGNGERTYHCSAGQCNPPDFDALVFKIKVL